MNSRDQFVETLKARLDAWNGQIASAEAMMKAASHEATAKFAEQVGEMRKRRDEAEQTLQEAMVKSSAEWDQRSREFKGAWDEIASGFSRAWSRLN